MVEGGIGAQSLITEMRNRIARISYADCLNPVTERLFFHLIFAPQNLIVVCGIYLLTMHL